MPSREVKVTGKGLATWTYHHSHRWYAPKIELHDRLTLFWGDTIVLLRIGFTSDGFSLPKVAIILTGGYLTNIMPGLAPALFHDYVCKNKEERFTINGEVRCMTSQERRQLFRDVSKCCVDKLGTRRARWLWHGVYFGSKYLGYC
jgi:hypothetical protein